MTEITIEELSEQAFAPFGWILGKKSSPEASEKAYRSEDIDFWEEHAFDAGVRGEAQVLWVNYRNRVREITSLEMHRRTEQIVVPVTGEIVQIVATHPAAESLRAFSVKAGQGICMRRECWHTTRVAAGEVRCLMVTRNSTTEDLIRHLKGGDELAESVIASLGVSRRLADSPR